MIRGIEEESIFDDNREEGDGVDYANFSSLSRKRGDSRDGVDKVDWLLGD
jgi:hypothetical protein